MALMSEKLRDAEPYNIFFTSHPDVEETHNHKNFITFSDLLCSSLGKLKYVLHVTTSIDLEWFLNEFDNAGLRDTTKIDIIYGFKDFGMDAYLENNQLSNVFTHKALLGDPYGKHHSKMSVLVYDDDSLRVVVPTANTDNVSWNRYAQIVWISPLCKPTAGSAFAGAGPTDFKGSLLQYLKNYPKHVVNECIEYIEVADFSDVKVFLVASVTGNHQINNPWSECHLERVAELLSEHCNIPDEFPNKWPIIIQPCTIGCIGLQNNWFGPALLRSIDSHRHNKKPTNSTANVQILYPSKQNVLSSLSIDYNPEMYFHYMLKNETWPNTMLRSWKADSSHLTKVMPRTKTYCRISPCGTMLAWFLLTSANTTKSAWGGNIKNSNQIHVRSFELGILFMPAYFGDEKSFKINDGSETQFPLMFNTPLTQTQYDEPWASDVIRFY